MSPPTTPPSMIRSRFWTTQLRQALLLLVGIQVCELVTRHLRRVRLGARLVSALLPLFLDRRDHGHQVLKATRTTLSNETAFLVVDLAASRLRTLNPRLLPFRRQRLLRMTPFRVRVLASRRPIPVPALLARIAPRCPFQTLSGAISLTVLAARISALFNASCANTYPSNCKTTPFPHRQTSRCLGGV